MIHENSTAYHLYQLLKPEERRDVLEVLEKRERRGGKPSQVKAVHLALAKADVRRDADLYEVLPAASKWKDLAQAKRKLARAYLDTLVMNAEHPAAVVRRMMTELELLAERGQNLSLLYLAQETITLARHHELYREAIDAYYMWDAAHVVSLNNDDAFPINDKATMLHAMREDAEKLHQLNQAEWFYQQSVWALESGDSELAKNLRLEHSISWNLSGYSRLALLVNKANYNVAFQLGDFKECKVRLESVLEIFTHRTDEASSLLLRPHLLFLLGIHAIQTNDELTYRKASSQLKKGHIEGAIGSGNYITLYYTLELQYSIFVSGRGRANLIASRLISQMAEDGYNGKIPSAGLVALVIYAYKEKDWESVGKYGMEFLATRKPRFITNLIVWLAVLSATSERQLLAVWKSQTKMAYTEMKKMNVPDGVLDFFNEACKNSEASFKDCVVKRYGVLAASLNIEDRKRIEENLGLSKKYLGRDQL